MKIFEGYQRGVNLGGWISQCVSYEKEHFDTFITEADIEKIAGWGLDHVRVPVDYEIIVTDDGAWKEEGFSYISSCISWCKRHHLNMILDLHKTKGYMFDTEAVANPDLFFTQKELQDFFVMIWKELATRYGCESDMLAFELLNEIVNPDYAGKWNEIALRAIKVIREIAPDNYILVGGTNYNSVSKVPEIMMPYDDKMVYNFHCYEPLVFTHQRAPWVIGMPEDFYMSYPAPVEEMLEKGKVIPQAAAGAMFEDHLDGEETSIFEPLFISAVRTCEERNVPLYCGEYGVIDRAPLADTVRWFEDIHSVFEKYHIGRSVWNYKQKDFGLVDPHYEDILEDIIRNL